jgi:hypothetical protein
MELEARFITMLRAARANEPGVSIEIERLEHSGFETLNGDRAHNSVICAEAHRRNKEFNSSRRTLTFEPRS